MAAPPPPHSLFATVLVLDFGSQYTHLITRRLRELHVYSEIYPCTAKLADLPFKPSSIILSGGPYSVYEDGAPHADPQVWDAGVPVLGICYGLQEMAWHFGGKGSVAAGTKREYGKAELQMVSEDGQKLFHGMEKNSTVWMSHGDKLARLPDDFKIVGQTANAPFAGIAHSSKPYYGIQFHPEVTHTPQGITLLKNFAIEICGIKPTWTMDRFVDQEIARIRDMVGPKGQVIGAVSGGVDSTVAAKLMKEAIGDRFHAVLVDNGLLRKDEAAQVKKTLGENLGINLHVVDAGELFLGRLKGVVDDPEKKRKIIGNTFIDVFLDKAKELEEAAKNTSAAGEIEFLLQGTLYPDVIESISFRGPSETIKTHHNVGGLPAKMRLKLIEVRLFIFCD
jgi:GMP synthase (glutamine-hydrolysing)